MGIEAIGAGDVMHAMGDVHARVAVIAVALNTVKQQGRDLVAIKIHLGDIFGNVDTVDFNVDVGVVESGEGHVANALLHGCNPYHRRVAQST